MRFLTPAGFGMTEAKRGGCPERMKSGEPEATHGDVEKEIVIASLESEETNNNKD